MSQQAMREQWHRAQADAQALSCWLNCYLREFALPRGEADFGAHGPDLPAGLAHGRGDILQLRFADSGYRLAIRVLRRSRLGRCDYLGMAYLKQPNQAWHGADALTVVHFLLERLAGECGFNGELLAQTGNSIEISAGLLKRSLDAQVSGDTMLDAEQGMLWGHALHPTPKSREGLAVEEVLACSPEARVAMPLYWFAIAPELLRCQGRDVSHVLVELSGERLRYPCHPWEARRLLAHPVMQQAIAQGLVRPLGPIGEPVAPTSSVRTVFHPALDYFLKLSIHVRLTNCVRKNAWYELESAVALTALLDDVWRDVRAHAPGFDVMPEPAATTLDFSAVSDDADAIRELGESFGMLYRENLSRLQRERFQPQVAGALFTTDRDGHSVCRRHVQALGGHYARTAEAWFDAYARLLLDGAWLAFFRHGVILEPHLQNTVLGFDRGMPARVWIRDLEGTKLVDTRWPAERLGVLSARARTSVHYTQAQGWKRVAYCALVNNLAEAIFHLAGDDRALEDRLWSAIGDIAMQWQAQHGAEALLQALVEGAALPSKNNLGTRLYRRADRDSQYTMLANPITPPQRARAAA